MISFIRHSKAGQNPYGITVTTVMPCEAALIREYMYAEIYQAIHLDLSFLLSVKSTSVK